MKMKLNKEKEIVIEKVVEREPGWLYYLDKEGNLCRSRMKGKRKEE